MGWEMCWQRRVTRLERKQLSFTWGPFRFGLRLFLGIVGEIYWKEVLLPTGAGWQAGGRVHNPGAQEEGKAHRG